MKTIAVLLLTFILSPVYAQVSFTGYLVNSDDDKLKDVTVILYSNNEIVSTQKWSKKFDYNLQLEKYYTLELVKEDFLTKKIAISTFGGDKDVEPFMFVIELKVAMNGEEGDDFPSALIKYKKGEGSFNFDVKYAKNLKKEQKLAKNE